MKLIAILVCLGIERYFRLGLHLQRFSWLNCYVAVLRKLIKPTVLWQGWLAVILVQLPLLIIVALICYLTAHHLYGFIGLLFSIVVLLYCLGPGDVYQEVQDYVAVAESPEANELQEQYLTAVIETAPPKTPAARTQALSAAIVVKGNDQLLGVLFWFLILGPIGAVFYRLTERLAKNVTGDLLIDAESQLMTLWQLINWVPARLTSLIYALLGNFANSFNIWLQDAQKGLNSNRQLLEDVGLASISASTDATEQGDQSVIAGQQALALLDRSLIMVIVLTGIFTLGALIY